MVRDFQSNQEKLGHLGTLHGLIKEQQSKASKQAQSGMRPHAAVRLANVE